MGRKSLGSALLSALFIMTLIAIAATAMSTRMQFDIYRTRLVIQSDKVLLASQAVAFWAMDKLANPELTLALLDSNGRVLDYPASLASIYPDMKIQGQVYDLQSRLNLNSLQERPFQLILLMLLKDNVQKVEVKALQLIVEATVAWIKPVQLSNGQDNWASYYAQQKPPYLSAAQPMQSVSEFRMVEGVTASIYKTMLPFITALPSSTPINVNTASKAVLMALGTGLTDGQVSEFLQHRKEKGFVDEADFKQFKMKYHIPDTLVTITSQYYVSIATVTSADLSLTHYTIIQRQVSDKKVVSIHLLSETLNMI